MHAPLTRHRQARPAAELRMAMVALDPHLTQPEPGRTDLYGLVPRRDHAQNRADVTYDFTGGRLMIEGLPSHEEADRRLSNCRKFQQGGVLTH